MVCYGFSAEYALERLQLRGEWFRATEGEAETHLGGYAEAAVYVLPRVQLAVRYGETHQTDGDVPAQFRTHREGAVGLSTGLTYTPGMYATDDEIVEAGWD